MFKKPDNWYRKAKGKANSMAALLHVKYLFSEVYSVDLHCVVEMNWPSEGHLIAKLSTS